MANIPFPTPTPNASTTREALQIIQNLHSMTVTNNQALLLAISMQLPGPLERKLALYHLLLKLPLPPLSPVALMTLLVAWPYLLVLCLFIVFVLFRFIIKTFVPFVLSKLPREKVKKVFLELTFPADTSKSAYATEQLYSLLHTLARQQSFWSRIGHNKNEYSLEIVSTKNEGIRYVLVTGEKFADIIKRNLLSYLPGIQVKDGNDYISPYITKEENNKKFIGIEEFKLSGHFALPLETQKTLKEHDPISYLTGNMTKLAPGELISFQVITTPLLFHTHDSYVHEMGKLKARIIKGEPLTPLLQKDIFQKIVSLPVISTLWLVIKIAVIIIFGLLGFVLEMIASMAHDSARVMPAVISQPQVKPQQILNPYEQELSTVVKGKIDQKLFEVSIRLLVVANDKEEVNMRLNGLLASFGQLSSAHQSLTSKGGLFAPKMKNQINQFKGRMLTNDSAFHHNPILSTSELSDLFHFPYTDTTKTEDMAKVHSVELPAPLSVKNNTRFDVVFGKNAYAGSVFDIGLTDEDRSRHVYIIGQTGSGKSTILFHMIKDDILRGRGTGIIDPHGDLAELVHSIVPLERTHDLILFNPSDLGYPIGINLLELTPGLTGDELEQEKELVCESVISIFRRLFNQDEHTDAHRIEYLLRNTIYTAFTVPDATIFTVYDLLTNPKFQKSVTKNLEDEHLKNFWNNEFGKAGSYQVVKMMSGVTAKIGRFLFSPTAKRILEQPKSTINFDDIVNNKKILICNVSEGKLGEDTAQLFGTVMIAKIHQAMMKRARLKTSERTPFYLFIDEFQNFATPYFTKLLSGGRKFGLRLTIAEQSTAQQDDRNMVNVILANVGTVICFRTASPMDEELMLEQFSPYVEKGNIGNLPQYHFYMKLSAVKPEEPFSGITLPIVIERDEEKIQQLIEASRKNYASVYKKPEKKKQEEKNPVADKTSEKMDKTKVNSTSKIGMPEDDQ